MAKASKLKDGHIIIFRTWVTDPKTGKRRYARNYGKRAWPIIVELHKEA